MTYSSIKFSLDSSSVTVEFILLSISTLNFFLISNETIIILTMTDIIRNILLVEQSY